MFMEERNIVASCVGVSIDWQPDAVGFEYSKVHRMIGLELDQGSKKRLSIT